MKTVVGDVFIPRQTAYCDDCTWVDRPTLDPRYSAVLRRTKSHVAKTRHAVVIDQLLRRTVSPL